MWRIGMPFKVERQDNVDSFYTCFIVHASKNESQEFNIPVWDADDFEAKVKAFTNTQFKAFKDKVGKKVARTNR